MTFSQIKNWYHKRRNPDHCDICRKQVKIQVLFGLLGNYCLKHGMMCAEFAYSGNSKYLEE
jgi:hypothetical protein